MRFEHIQSEEALKKFFTSRGFEIQEYDKSLIRIDKLHFLQVKIVDVLDRDTAYQEHKEFKNKFRDVPYQLLVERTFKKFMFQRDRGTPLRFTYDRTKRYARETEGSIFKKLNLLKYEDSEFNNRINNLFDVKEIVNKFYEEYKRIKNKLAGAITNIDGDPELYAQILLDRIIFLYFLQTKGVLSKTYLSGLFYSKKITENFYSDYLIPLFFEGLNTEKHSEEFEEKFGAVPYLNGGLFSPKDMEKNGNIQIEDGVWNEVFELLNGYEWVIEEREGDSATLTPSILGHIYEKSITATQKETGSYYTPEEITSYISMNTIYPYIQDRIKEKFGVEYEKIFKQLLDKTEHTQEETEIIKYIYFDILKNLKICDNACGSGAFLIAAQQILMPIYDRCIKALMNLPLFGEEWKRIIRYKNPNYFIKKEIITRNLYGVDIQEGAVEIAKLRLWLSMVSEMELKAEDIEPLPNIDYNILSGNSLVGYIEPEEIEIGEGAFLEKGKSPGQQKIGEEKVKQMKFVTGKSVTEIMKARKELIEDYREERKSAVAREIREDIEGIGKPLRAELNKKFYQKLLGEGIKLTEEEFLKLKPFHWGFEFYEAFDPEKPKEVGGFDIIIGNPPYGNILKEEERVWINNTYPFKEHFDIYPTFIERCFFSLKKSGLLGYIVPSSWETGVRYSKFREYLLERYTLAQTINMPFDVFQDAYVDNCISIFKNILPEDTDKILIHSYHKKSKIDNLNRLKITDKIRYQLITSDGDKRIFPNPDIYKLIEYMRKNCNYDPLGNITDSTIGILASKYKFSEKKINEYHLPYIEGRCDRYICQLEFKNYLDFKQHFNNEQYLDYYLSKGKIVIRRIVNRQDRIMCSFLTKEGVVRKDLYIFTMLSKEVNPIYLLVLLNSKLISYFYVSKSTIALKDDFRQTTLGELRELPIIKISSSEQGPFIALSKYLLFLNETEGRRKNEKELIEFIDKQIIDSLVYELYFREKFEEEGLKSNLLGLVEPCLKDIENSETNEEKLKVIKEVVERIKSDKKVKREIEKIKSHEWVKVIEWGK